VSEGDRGRADVAGPAADAGDFTGSKAAVDEAGKVGGCRRVRDSDSQRGVDALGKAVAAFGRHDGILREAALPAVVAEAVGPPAPSHQRAARTSVGGGADQAAPQHERERDARRVAPRADEGVHRVGRDQDHDHEDVGRTMGGHGQLADHELVWCPSRST
jgi:hypothetical protein